ncbi:hypothetical protein FACS1894105_04010 [Clostridia bacterium]|nr:hypothetical protein FACS1894105_04010 [Clostridia bacterium]
MSRKIKGLRVIAAILVSVMITTLFASIIAYAQSPETTTETIVTPPSSVGSFNIDYEGERIIAAGYVYDAANPVKYLYSPKVEKNAKNTSGEQWYPLYGGELDISKFISKDENNAVSFAFRRADDLGIDGVYSTREVVTFKGRERKSGEFFKTAFSYDSVNERINVRTTEKYDYQVGYSGWILNNSASSIPVPSAVILSSTTIVVRISADTDSFHTNEYKIKIPKTQAAPKIMVNTQTKKINGIKNEYVWDTEQNGDYKNDFDGLKSIPYGILGRVLGDAVEDLTYCDENGDTGVGSQYETHFVLYVKATATAKKPASLVQKLVISKALL